MLQNENRRLRSCRDGGFKLYAAEENIKE